METLPSDSPGDCQAVAAAADSTTAALGLLRPLATPGPGVDDLLLQHVSSTTMALAMADSSPPTSTAAAAAALNPGGNSNNNNSNSNNGGKPKPPQPQAQPPQNPAAVKFHQFRAPQQFVKHKRPTSMLAKKNKTWNKRQNKSHPNKQQLQQGSCGLLAAGGAAPANVVGGAAPATKADLENIQNLKNQLGGGGGGHHPYYHHGRGGSNGLAPCLCSLDKLGYGHGHLKQSQLYKKMLVHRGHHHHVLCAGAAHNAGGGASGGCCLANGCPERLQNGKDAASGNGHGSTGGGGTAPQALHYCCGRSKFFLPDKRPRKEVIIPPTKFLLGGNISDPLNLTSLQNEASNESSNSNTPATTPRQSPITTPPKVEVIIPPNIHDPLHLLDPVDSMEYEKQLTSPMKRKSKSNKSKNRHRKNRKPKRRRYESYNSASMDDDAVSLGANGTGPGSGPALANSTMSTEGANSTMSMSLASAENTSAVCAEAYDDEAEESRNSPAPAGESLLSAELVETSTATLSPNGPQQHVAGTAGEASAGDMLLARRSSERERVSKDLRLELSMCGVGTANHSHGHNNNSASSSTCGSVAGGGGGGRKRKISESSNSQKNKKFHRLDSMDKIVSPVVPQPGAWKRPPRLVPTGARKASRRSTSISETELLSPADDAVRTLNDTESNRGDTPDLSKMESVSEAGVGSPLSTNSGATSVAAGEQDSMAEVSLGEACTTTAATAEAAGASTGAGTSNTVAQLTKTPKFRPDGAKYMYGNYDRYAGFRHLNEFMDVRLQVFQRHLELFQNKDILDIGCNVGHMTITVARNLAPKSILGIDIDKELIARARRNLSMHVRIPPDPKPKAEVTAAPEAKSGQAAEVAGSKKSKKSRRQRQKKHRQTQANSALHSHHHHHHGLLHHQHLLQQQQANKLHVDASELFPVAFPLSYGSIPDMNGGAATGTATPLTSGSTPGHVSGAGGGCKARNDFPKNVFFRQTNYVLKDESQLINDSQQYDLIMCLSVTKWIHLNFGDNGLKLAFKRMFNQLRPGGKLILEAQNWASYKKKKNLTEQIYNNYRGIEFFPNKFHEYLLSSEVGFSHSCTLGVPRHMNKGFCRPIQLYAKGDYTPNHVRWSDAYYPQTPYEAYRGIYATMPPRPAGSSGVAYPMMSSSRSQTYDTPHHPGVGGGGGSGSGSYSCRQTPMHQPTSQYYNPLETDSYLPSYDMEYLNHLYVFASPLYQTVWSPPASLRNSSSHTPLFGSVREAELDGDGGSGGTGGGSYHRHVYPPNEDTSSPNASNGGAFNSIRDPDTDDSNQLPASSVQHVYATNCESSSSPQVHHHDSEPLDDALILADVGDDGVAVPGASNSCCDEA